MSDKTEDEKPQLVQPPIPGGGIYEKFRQPVPGAPAATPPVDAAAATAAATQVQPGLQDAILKLLPKWGPLVERVEALEQAIDKGAHYLDAEGAKDVDVLKQRQDELAGRLDGLTTVVGELREELGADEDDDGK